MRVGALDIVGLLEKELELITHCLLLLELERLMQPVVTSGSDRTGEAARQQALAVPVPNCRVDGRDMKVSDAQVFLYSSKQIVNDCICGSRVLSQVAGEPFYPRGILGNAWRWAVARRWIYAVAPKGDNT
jgi:hypothetical protein